MPFPPPGDLADSGTELTSFFSPALAGRFFTTSTTWKAYIYIYMYMLVCVYIYIYMMNRSIILGIRERN